jgi:homoserine kinase
MYRGGMLRATAYAPGSTSNLGPGFDCLGVAFTGKGDTVTAERTGRPGVRVVSVSDHRIPREASRNTAAIAASVLLERSGNHVGLEISVEKGLPLSGGMGGSAASAVAGALAANAALDAGFPAEVLLEAALDAEAVVAGRHADNVAASLLGGAVLVSGGAGTTPRLCRVRVHPSFALVLVTPSYEVLTAAARAVLPTQVSRSDAVTQAATLAGLVLGLERGEADLVAASMSDRIAEPVRAPLYPGYPQARSAALEAGAVGVTVSGAGPTLVAIVPAGASGAVAAAFEDAYRRAGFSSAAHAARVDEEGARLIK